ncbi:LruC domain-containing protein [bacterium]|nr:LruC domain-containing protein [bacterium]
MRLKAWQLITIATLALVALLGVSCGGGGSAPVGGDLGGNDDPPSLVGDISDGVNPNDVPVAGPVEGVFEDAPLGTDPEYQVQTADEIIETHLVSHSTSGLKSVSDDPLFWVAIVLRDEEPTPGLASQSFHEGDEVDLYMRYQVFEGQLTISREWHVDAIGLHFVQPEVEHAQAGTYEATFPISIPFECATQDAMFIGVWGLPRTTSSVTIPDSSDFREVSFEILATPTLTPIDYPNNLGNVEGLAQLGWEDLLSGSDYDYNDFVGKMHATELRNEDNELVQIQLTLKAVARSAGYDSDWQFNINAAFPTVNDVDVLAIVDQYYADGTPHGYQRVYASAGGMSVPIFTPIRDALPNPPGSYATNGIPGTEFIDGDYCEVTIILNKPLAQGAYTPIPYKPELRVHPYNGGIYTIGLWTQPGDPVDSYGRPLAFIVPDTYAWPLEGKRIWYCYDGFPDWIQWIGNPDTAAPNPIWYDETPVADLVFSRDKFTP